MSYITPESLKGDQASIPEHLLPELPKRLGYQCEIIEDSVSPYGIRLTTAWIKYPLIVHAEMTRSRAFSRSVASNRAIPTEKIIAMVEQDPFIPEYWGANQAGMQAYEELTGEERDDAEYLWIRAKDSAIESAKALNAVGLHKQLANRVLSPYQWVNEVISATDWDNFFALRCHPAAQPEIRTIAEMLRDAYYSHDPKPIAACDWHLPYVTAEEKEKHPIEILRDVSAARCARTSYRTHDGRVSTVEEDVKLVRERLMSAIPLHASPTEHVAMATYTESRCGNFRGWWQYRYSFDNHTITDYPGNQGSIREENRNALR